jgi:hypothetical protein
VLDRFGTHFAGGWAEQGQQFSRPATHVLVRLTDGLFLRLPGWAGLRDRLERARFILGRHLQTQVLADAVRPLDHLFLGVASGSVVRTTDPSFRLRKAEPVWHQVRLAGGSARVFRQLLMPKGTTG